MPESGSGKGASPHDTKAHGTDPRDRGRAPEPAGVVPYVAAFEAQKRIMPARSSGGTGTGRRLASDT
jgi:hypothetical protein